MPPPSGVKGTGRQTQGQKCNFLEKSPFGLKYCSQSKIPVPSAWGVWVGGMISFLLFILQLPLYLCTSKSCSKQTFQTKEGKTSIPTGHPSTDVNSDTPEDRFAARRKLIELFADVILTATPPSSVSSTSVSRVSVEMFFLGLDCRFAVSSVSCQQFPA